MATKTHDASTSSDCGCKKVGMIAQKVGGSKNLNPVMVEYVADTPDNQEYVGAATRTIYRGIVHGSILQLYLADYRADVDAFNLV